jgi:hypothetical protein
MSTQRLEACAGFTAQTMAESTLFVSTMLETNLVRQIPLSPAIRIDPDGGPMDGGGHRCGIRDWDTRGTGNALCKILR